MWPGSINCNRTRNSVWLLGAHHDDLCWGGNVDIKHSALCVEYRPAGPAWHPNAIYHSSLLYVHDRKSKRILNVGIADIGRQEKSPGRVVSESVGANSYGDFLQTCLVVGTENSDGIFCPIGGEYQVLFIRN